MAVGSERGTTHLDVLAVDQLFVAGSVTGSVIKGSAANDSVTFTSLLGTSFYSLVGTIVGSQAHGLGAAPTAVMIAPVMDFGTFGAPYQRAAAGTLHCYVSAGTTGTVQITALA